MCKSTIKKKTLWIAWEKHRRTVSLCTHFNINSIIYNDISSRLIKYFIYSFRTIISLNSARPEILFVQNPSIVLSFLVSLLKPYFRYQLVVDSHNSGISPDNKFLQMMPWIYRYVQKSADVTIVTNHGLASLVAKNNGTPFVMPDRLPEINLTKPVFAPKDEFKIVYICTFGTDEPYRNLIEAARHFHNNVVFYVTGKTDKAPRHVILNRPDNLVFTNFLPDDQYWKLLTSSDLIIDLTNRTDCLVCGAYEAVAAEIPLILSDTKALREYFSMGCVFTHNSTNDIIESVKYAVTNIRDLQNNVIKLKTQIQHSWLQIDEAFRSLLETM